MRSRRSSVPGRSGASVEALETRTHLAVAPAPALLVSTGTSIVKFATDGSRTTFATGVFDYTGVEVVGSTIYAVNSAKTAILGFNSSGAQVSSTPIPGSITSMIGFSALSDGRFAIMDNVTDNVYFLDSDGTLLHTTPIKSPADAGGQVMSGVEVDGQLIVSNDGDMNIVAFDLTTYAASLFKSISITDSWIGALDRNGSTYYVGSSYHVTQFTQAGAVTNLSTFTNGNITGIANKDGYGYVTHNGDDAVYRVNLSDGAASLLYGSVTYPQDVELAPLPVVTSPLVINGTEGADTIDLVQTGDDLAVTINGGAASHHSVSLISTLRINGLGGNDAITLDGDIAALIYGNAGNDTIAGGSGNDSIYAGWDDDSVTGGAGDDLIRCGLGNDTAYGNEGYDEIYGGMGDDEIHGNQDADQIFGKDGADQLFGGLGDDYVCGQGKNDLVHGGPGNDSLSGDAGNDTVYGDQNDDAIDLLDSPLLFADWADGGLGIDDADHDDNDTLLNCEDVVPV